MSSISGLQFDQEQFAVFGVVRFGSGLSVPHEGEGQTGRGFAVKGESAGLLEARRMARVEVDEQKFVKELFGRRLGRGPDLLVGGRLFDCDPLAGIHRKIRSRADCPRRRDISGSRYWCFL